MSSLIKGIVPLSTVRIQAYILQYKKYWQGVFSVQIRQYHFTFFFSLMHCFKWKKNGSHHFKSLITLLNVSCFRMISIEKLENFRFALGKFLK